MNRLANWCIPTTALRWGRLTNEPPPPYDHTAAFERLMALHAPRRTHR